MFCPDCSSDKFETIRVYRNRRYNPQQRRWIYSDDHDVRKVICAKCGTAYLTESSIICKIKLLPDGTSSVQWEPNKPPKEKNE